MSRVQTSIPTDFTSLIRVLRRELERSNFQVTFGTPNTSGEEGGSANIDGVWLKLDLANGNNTITHNLDLPVTAGTPNVGILVFGQKATGTLYYNAGTVAANAIDMTWSGAGTDRVLAFVVATGDW